MGENLKKVISFFIIISLCRFGLLKFVIMISRKVSQLGASNFGQLIEDEEKINR